MPTEQVKTALGLLGRIGLGAGIGGFGGALYGGGNTLTGAALGAGVGALTGGKGGAQAGAAAGKAERAAATASKAGRGAVAPEAAGYVEGPGALAKPPVMTKATTDPNQFWANPVKIPTPAPATVAPEFWQELSQATRPTVRPPAHAWEARNRAWIERTAPGGNPYQTELVNINPRSLSPTMQEAEAARSQNVLERLEQMQGKTGAYILGCNAACDALSLGRAVSVR